MTNGQVRYALHRLWNPATKKGLFATLVRGQAVKLVEELLKESDEFFARVETACEEIHRGARRKRGGGDSNGNDRRTWSELRIRRPELVEDNITLPIQRLREAVSHLIKTSEDKDTGQELVESNRRLAELYDGVAVFLNQSAQEHVYWVERAGKTFDPRGLETVPEGVEHANGHAHVDAASGGDRRAEAVRPRAREERQLLAVAELPAQRGGDLVHVLANSGALA